MCTYLQWCWPSPHWPYALRPWRQPRPARKWLRWLGPRVAAISGPPAPLRHPQSAGCTRSACTRTWRCVRVYTECLHAHMEVRAGVHRVPARAHGGACRSLQQQVPCNGGFSFAAHQLTAQTCVLCVLCARACVCACVCVCVHPSRARWRGWIVGSAAVWPRHPAVSTAWTACALARMGVGVGRAPATSPP